MCGTERGECHVVRMSRDNVFMDLPRCHSDVVCLFGFERVLDYAPAPFVDLYNLCGSKTQKLRSAICFGSVTIYAECW